MEPFCFKLNNYRYWPVALFAGLFSILIGILTFFRPLLVELTIVAIIGIMFIQGFFLALFSFQISRMKKLNSNSVAMAGRLIIHLVLHYNGEHKCGLDFVRKVLSMKPIISNLLLIIKNQEL